MGQAVSYGLTQYDMEEVKEYSGGVFNQRELEALYKRFRSLDRGRKGYISADEFLSVPELSINPLAQRLVRLFESVNYKEFVKLLSAFSSRADREAKLDFMFQVYDVDGDGVISRDDLQMMLRQLAGSSITDEDLDAVIKRTFSEAKTTAGLDIHQFKACLKDADNIRMVVDVPVEL